MTECHPHYVRVTTVSTGQWGYIDGTSDMCLLITTPLVRVVKVVYIE